MASQPPRRATACTMQDFVDVHGALRLHEQPIDDIPDDADEVEVAVDSGSEGKEDDVEIEELGSNEDNWSSDRDERMIEVGDASDNDDFWIGRDGTRWESNHFKLQLDINLPILSGMPAESPTNVT